MTKGLKRYEVKKSDKVPCEVCWKPFTPEDICSISYRTTNKMRRYQSGRPLVGTYKIRACPTCYKEVREAVDEAIEKICQSKAKNF